MSDQASSMAEATTDWARERTRLAKERTFAALIRTALSFIGFGIAIAKLLPDLHPAWVVRTVGILLIAGGGVTAYLGSRSIHDVVTKLREEGVKEPRWFVTTTTVLLLVTAILALLVFDVIVTIQVDADLLHVATTLGMIILAGAFLGIAGGHLLGLAIRHRVLPDLLREFAALAPGE